ncbi:unnamed protein product [Agarophyton chilense]
MKAPILHLGIFLFSSLAFSQTINYVPHKDLKPIYSKLGGVYEAYRWYQPAIKVLNGCVPFPAVGKYTASRGLKIGGARNGLCSKNTGQVYARHKNYKEKKVHGIMYAYYFPKDQVFAGGASPGHRHDWEEAIIWVNWDWTRPLGASMSGHGDYTHSSRNWCGSHKKVLYANGNTINGISHEFRDSGGDGCSHNHPIANWYQLSKEVRYTLNKARWLDQKGKQRATPKINDDNFGSKMDKAFREFF